MLECSYNSVVFSSLSTNDYMALLVAPEFLGTGSHNQTLLRGFHISDEMQPTLYNLGLNSKNLTRLNNTACIQAYADDWIFEWRNVLLVTNRHSNNSNGHSNNSIFDMYVSYHETALNDPTWLCGLYQAQDTTKNCDLGDLTAHPNNWSMTFWPWNDIETPCLGTSDKCNYAGFQTVQIDHCLAEPIKPRCRISISTPLLIAVIICNATKFTCLVCTLLLRDFKPLITVGDAIASFLRSPDERTRKCGLLSAQNLRYKYSPVNEGKSETLLLCPSACLPQKWEWKHEWWFHGASTGRWLWCLLL